MIKTRHIFILLCILLVFSASCRYLRIPDKKAKLEFSRQDLFPHFMYMSVDHVNLHYVKAGSDTLPTLFFIHGSPGSWKGYREYLMDPDLLKHFRIIVIDRPGFGYSDAGHSYHLSDQARLIYDIVKKEQNDRPLSFPASIWIAPANSRKLSIKFINTSWKSTELASCTAFSDNRDFEFPRATKITEQISDRAMIPIVGGHLIAL